MRGIACIESNGRFLALLAVTNSSNARDHNVRNLGRLRKTMANDQEKEAAARASLQFVKDGQVVGLGTGSTAAFFIKLLAERGEEWAADSRDSDFGAIAGTGAEPGNSADHAGRMPGDRRHGGWRG